MLVRAPVREQPTFNWVMQWRSHFPMTVFDVAVMALVIFFVPDPAKGVAEMARVVRPGGEVAAYVWDTIGGKGAAAPIESEIAGDGPHATASTEFRSLADRGTSGIVVGRGSRCDKDKRDRSATNFRRLRRFLDDYVAHPDPPPDIEAMPSKDKELLKTRVCARLPADGRITYEARANAVKGRMPE
jgi:SAM-dependent methyltransferase